MSTEEHVFTRRYIRTDQPVWPFFWRGLLPLLALVLVIGYSCSRFAYNDIEQAVRTSTTQTLAAAGIDWLEVSVDGQQVHLEGSAPAGFTLEGHSDKSGLQTALVALAKQAKCPTWAGAQACATNVTATLLQSTSGTKTPKPEATTTTWPDMQTALTDGMLMLSGAVPDDRMKRLLGDLATSKADPPRIRGVQNDLEVVQSKAPAAFVTLAERTVDIAALFERGVAAVENGTFSAHGDVHQATLAAVKTAARTPVEGAKIGTIELFVFEAVEACEKNLAALMKTAHIKFSTGSATIDAASGALLDKVAASAKTCPGMLQIEGHTDSTGSASKNVALSKARAAAVKAALVERGLSGSKLLARGLGALRPAASNDTDAGRAKNRRIEFHVVHDSPQ